MLTGGIAEVKIFLSIYFMHIDKMCLQQNATQMLRANTVPSSWGGGTYNRPIRANTVPSSWGGATYKCLVPAQNRLPNALAEEVEGGLNNLEIKLFVVFIFIMTFLHMCEILECIVGFYPIVFYLAHIVALYTSIVLLSYLMLVIYISVPVAHFVEGDKI